MISKIVERRWDGEVGQITVSEIDGNLLDHEDRYPCLVMDELSETDLDLLYSAGGEHVYISLIEVINLPFTRLLAKANEQKWHSIGFSVNPDTDFHPIFDACNEWEAEYPCRLDFYTISCNKPENDMQYDQNDYMAGCGQY